jgi:hypothetical protein
MCVGSTTKGQAVSGARFVCQGLGAHHITGTRTVCMAAKQRPNALFCMPNRTKGILFVLVPGTRGALGCWSVGTLGAAQETVGP